MKKPIICATLAVTMPIFAGEHQEPRFEIIPVVNAIAASSFACAQRAPSTSYCATVSPESSDKICFETQQDFDDYLFTTLKKYKDEQWLWQEKHVSAVKRNKEEPRTESLQKEISQTCSKDDGVAHACFECINRRSSAVDVELINKRILDYLGHVTYVEKFGNAYRIDAVDPITGEVIEEEWWATQEKAERTQKHRITYMPFLKELDSLRLLFLSDASQAWADHQAYGVSQHDPVAYPMYLSLPDTIKNRPGLFSVTKKPAQFIFN